MSATQMTKAAENKRAAMPPMVKVRALGDRGHVAVAVIDGKIGLQVSGANGEVSVILSEDEAADVAAALDSADYLVARQEAQA